VSDDAAELWKLNHRVLTVVMNACAPDLAALGLETKEFFVLDEIDACRFPAVLATKLMLPKASVTMYLRNLSAKGLISREIDQADLRRHRLVTTERGREVLRQALDALSREFESRLHGLGQADRAELRRILNAILEAEPAGIAPGA
jgi:DNA-binding MarR family transcriptional regulator